MTIIIIRSAAYIAIITALFATVFVVTATSNASPVPAGAVIWEDGSWSTPDGRNGCIPGELCDDTV